MDDPLTRVLERLESVRKSGGQWWAKCPGHEDRNPSLRIAAGEVGVLLNCKAGCTANSVREALGLEWSELFWESSSVASSLPYVRTKAHDVGKTTANMTREDIEHEHDYGTMTDQEYMDALAQWHRGGEDWRRRTVVDFDDQGEVTYYALMADKDGRR